ncbi:hypothetical protein NC651_032979 [Populus alba x Populus x berolinensis]|nr:hypothetical protein NC651_032979 [Populus alba x Populus x berolinensis]
MEQFGGLCSSGSSQYFWGRVCMPLRQLCTELWEDGDRYRDVYRVSACIIYTLPLLWAKPLRSFVNTRSTQLEWESLFAMVPINIHELASSICSKP